MTNDTFKLSENTFSLVPAGDHVPLKITQVKALPKAKPSKIEVTFKHEATGAILKNNYDIKNQGGLIAFSILARCILGANLENFSISQDLPKFKDKTIDCEVVHTDPSQSEKGYVYANIRKTLSVIDDVKTYTPEETNLEDLEIDEEDDI